MRPTSGSVRGLMGVLIPALVLGITGRAGIDCAVRGRGAAHYGRVPLPRVRR